MGAAHSASEEVRELVGKTGCEYLAGDGRGDTGRDRQKALTGNPSPPPPSRLRAACFVTLGWPALCASVSPTFQWAPAATLQAAAMLSKCRGH